MNNYKTFGSKTIDIVIEMGLGACIAEWESLARELGKDHGVLVYERAGINHSDKSDKERTPTNIAEELMNLLDGIPHDEKIVIIGHSQGGLYACEFCGIYPEIVKGLILPLIYTGIATDKHFKENQGNKHQWNARYGWYRYNSRFALPVFSEDGVVERYNVFHASLLIRHDNNGKMYLYDVIDIKRNEQPFGVIDFTWQKPISLCVKSNIYRNGMSIR